MTYQEPPPDPTLYRYQPQTPTPPPQAHPGYYQSPGYPAPPPPPAAPARKDDGKTWRWVVLIGTAVIALLIGYAIGAAGKSTTKTAASTVVTVTAAPNDSSGDVAKGPSSAAPSSSAASSKAHVGSTISLKGEQSADVMDVTLVQVAVTAAASDGFDKPPAGDRYYAAQFRLVNNGKETYSDSIDNDAIGLDSQGQQYQTDIVEGITQGPLFADPVNIPVGSTALGWIVFDVPVGTTITALQFSLNSSFGNTGQWAVP